MFLKAGLPGLSLLYALAAATPSEVLSVDFADPSILYDPNSGDWYAFATAGNGENVQVANAASPTGPWTLLDIDLLPNGMGSWAVDTGIWAPDVRYLSQSDSFVMYYSAVVADNTSFHCIGAATADTIEGPYTPVDTSLACPTDQGGAIDPSGYWDEASSTRWLVYKVDGNNIGHGGLCNNGVDPIQPTPIMLQQLDDDGYTLIGSATEVLDRSDADGPLIEAPNLIYDDDTYIIFFSSSCYSTTLYDISYATSSSLTGPYTKSSAPLLVTGDYGLTAPGGATSVVGGGQMVFHANCDEGRCMFETSYSVSDDVVTIT
ncbi:Extracellular endo-alpha-(1-_5)-L-arabinanase 1 [Cytospora mali]|uniref:Extracellular endo-alpha-(1->5)-L-arabinanase 1 n=1 Tax=Cytospora mali TaxID=578113 RepID=A0A194VQ18_CYTMA|nr:Extracellular endo-alpha-(1->5)-L-arabinanase 1 [Valsa mali]